MVERTIQAVIADVRDDTECRKRYGDAPTQPDIPASYADLVAAMVDTNSGAVKADRVPRAARGHWPNGCLKTAGCERRRACGYAGCPHMDRDIAAEVDAATRPRDPACTKWEGRADG